MQAPLPTVLDQSEDELGQAAEKASATVRRHAARWQALGTPEATCRQVLQQLMRRHRIEPPNKRTMLEVLNRLKDAAWWRRALRKRFRELEHAAIHAGRVHRHATPYVSERAMRRAERDRRRLSELLASMEAINRSTGEVIALDDLVESSLANPTNRRKALMARIKGTEQYALSLGLEAWFLTLTCPSRMHARQWITGAANPRYDGTDPRKAQAYLSRVWRNAGRKLAHAGVELSGIRVVEPHHDGCPHWHVLVFIAPDDAPFALQTLRAYALAESPNEPGAASRRFKAKRIDPEQGSAVGYVAKYVSKNVDGTGVDHDDESQASGADASRRIVAWARLWSIRQFQFFGLPAITPTRELHRLQSLPVESPSLSAVLQACQANDYAAWLRECALHGLRFTVDHIERPSSRYPEEVSQRIHGLTAHAPDLAEPAKLVTREDLWCIQPKPKAAEERDNAAAGAAPWTRFNNCAPVDFKGLFPPIDSGPEGFLSPSDLAAPPRRRPPPRTAMRRSEIREGEAC
ncbi:MAG: replication endonuclease [Aquabacterium sp.]|nr:MAG: replication endonuclease [Aquabacterium sp.]